MPAKPVLDIRALGQARILAAKQGAALSVRSLTADEVAERDRRPLVWGPPLFLAVSCIFVVPLSLQGGRQAAHMLPWVIMTVLFCGFALAGIGLIYARRRKGYQDPKFVVEVSGVNVIVCGPKGELALNYPELDLSVTNSMNYDGAGQHLAFVGVVINTAFGPVRVEDNWFKGGKAAAAMIVMRCEKEGMFDYR